MKIFKKKKKKKRCSIRPSKFPAVIPVLLVPKKKKL